MSCYEWEAGTIQLPKTQFAKIRKQFIVDYNKIVQQTMDTANKIREEALQKYKGKRNLNWYHIMGEYEEISYEILLMMFPTFEHWKPEVYTKKPIKLTKKVMAELFANSKTMSFPLEEGSIYFDDTDKTVTYSVPENNHARDHARESPVGRLFFRTMDNVNWTRGSGGCLYGNDEYNEHESYGGAGGGNYVTAEWGSKR